MIRRGTESEARKKRWGKRYTYLKEKTTERQEKRKEKIRGQGEKRGKNNKKGGKGRGHYLSRNGVQSLLFLCNVSHVHVRLHLRRESSSYLSSPCFLSTSTSPSLYLPIYLPSQREPRFLFSLSSTLCSLLSFLSILLSSPLTVLGEGRSG